MTVDQPKESQVGFLRLPEVLQLIPFSRSHWWALVKDCRAPKPVQFGRITMWRKVDIFEFIEQISRGEEYRPQ